MLTDQKDKTADVATLGNMRVLVYGEKKVGKTTLASQFPNAFILDIEDGMRMISSELKANGVDFRTVDSWQQLRKITKLVAAVAKDKGYDTLVLDGLGTADLMAQRYVIKVKGNGTDDINSGDLGYGRGLRTVAAEMGQWIDDAYATGLGVVMVAHQQWHEPDGAPASMMPEMSVRSWNYIKPKIDVVLRAVKQPGENGVEHVLVARDTISSETGAPAGFPASVPMNYAALNAAFDAAMGGNKA
jgi:hypothetical protein